MPCRAGRLPAHEKCLFHVFGFDDASFQREHLGNVLAVGAVFAGARLDGVLSVSVLRDGVNATERLAECVKGSRFYLQLQAILLQGIAPAGFNVVDVHALHADTGLPVLVVARRAPDLSAIRKALLDHVPDGARKWKLIERAGPMEPMAGIHVQRAGLAPTEAERLVRACQLHGKFPRTLARGASRRGGVTLGESRQRA